MRRMARLLAILGAIGMFLSFSTTASAFNLGHLLGNAKDDEGFRELTVSELAAMLKRDKPQVYVYDANPPEVRSEYGIIPNARLLSDPERYDVARTLPPSRDATLVFYCHNSW